MNNKAQLLKFIKEHSSDDWLEKRYGGYFMLIFMQGYFAVVAAHKMTDLSMPHGQCFQNINSPREFNWFWNVEEMKASRKKLFSRLEKDNNYGRQFYQDYMSGWREFIFLAKEEEKTDYHNLSSQGLIDHLLTLFNIGQKQGYSYVVDCLLGFADDDWFKDFLVGELKYDLSEQELDTLREPTHRTFVNEVELLVLQAACKKSKGEDVNADIKEITEQYYWIENNYLKGTPLAESDFRTRIEQVKNACQGHQEESERIVKNKAAKEVVYNKIKASGLCKSFVQLADDFTFIQDCRKQVILKLNHFYFLYLQELAKRLQIDRENLLYLTPFELENILKNKEELISIAQTRQKGSLILLNKDGYAICLKDELSEINLDDFFKDYSDVKEVKGTSACIGVVKGVARIVLGSEQFANFQDDDILVTNQTTPDFVPLMKKAGAVIAEQGGVTSHAAIVSRELGVPCVVGVKDAMRIFEDGEEVEVDADSGIVRKCN